MKKIIMFTGGIETQEYFTLQLARAFKDMGHPIFLYRLNEEEKDFIPLCDFIEKNNTVMITFNFHGINFEKPFYHNQQIFWNTTEIPCYNIVLDHPFYYNEFLSDVPTHYIQLSIDKGHERYMKRFFPNIKLGPFLPLAGTEISNNPLKERSKDIVFTGNYTPPSKFDQYITRIDDDYTEFYHGIIDDLIAHPGMEIDKTFEKHLIREMKDLSDNDIKVCMGNMTFIDLYVRFYFRGLTVKTLADNGFPVHVYGGGWNLLECKHPENIILSKPVQSYGCLKAISDGKISLNVMPWFKDGAHDRIFNSILNGAVSLSDDSKWLRENLEDRKEIVYYSLSEPCQLPFIVNELLNDTERMEEIIQNGYKNASTYHTWKCRAETLNDMIIR